jgi:hypothetical protein
VDPGDTVIFRDGVYRGSSYMINPPSGLNGTASQPIIVSSETDGGVEIDGEGARLPVRLGDNDYLIIEGFNLHNSSGAVVVVSTPSDYNLFRRIVAWDARDMNHHVFSISGGTGNVCEDCAGFGVARKTFEFYRQTDGTCRRCWGRWEGSTNQGPKMTFSLWYNGTGTVCENCIMTWDNGSMPSSYYLHHNGSHLGGSSRNGCSSVDQPYGTVSRDRIDDGTQARARVYGSIFYVSGQSSSLYNCFDASDVVGISNENDVRLSNVMAPVRPTIYRLPTRQVSEFEAIRSARSGSRPTSSTPRASAVSATRSTRATARMSAIGTRMGSRLIRNCGLGPCSRESWTPRLRQAPRDTRME